MAKGFRGRGKNCITVARPKVEKALQYAYRDRRTKKRDMRSLWITRINAAGRGAGRRPIPMPRTSEHRPRARCPPEPPRVDARTHCHVACCHCARPRALVRATFFQAPCAASLLFQKYIQYIYINKKILWPCHL